MFSSLRSSLCGSGQPEADNEYTTTADNFAQTVPVTAGAARIVLLDPNSVILSYVNLGGTAAPTVSITSPTRGGLQRQLVHRLDDQRP